MFMRELLVLFFSGVGDRLGSDVEFFLSVALIWVLFSLLGGGFMFLSFSLLSLIKKQKKQLSNFSCIISLI